MTCKNCHAKIQAGLTACPVCGTKLTNTEKRRCPFCGAELEEGKLFCGECGAVCSDPLEYREEEYVPPKPTPDPEQDAHGIYRPVPPNTDTTGQQRTGRKKPAGIPAAAVVVLLVAAAALGAGISAFLNGSWNSPGNPGNGSGSGSSQPAGSGASSVIVGPGSGSGGGGESGSEVIQIPEENLTAVGNTPGNIMNYGLIVADDEGNQYYCDDGGHRIWSEALGRNIVQSDEEFYSCLSYQNEKLFFLSGQGLGYGNTAYLYDIESLEIRKISGLEDFEGRITIMFLTEDCFVVGVQDWNSDDTQSIFKVSRYNGQQTYLASASLFSSFTISDHGILYYMTEREEGDYQGCRGINKVDMKTLETKGYIDAHDPDYILGAPVAVKDDLYFTILDRDYENQDARMLIVKYNLNKEGPAAEWDIDKELDYNCYEYPMLNVNSNNGQIYLSFCDEAGVFRILIMEGYEDRTFILDDSIPGDSYCPNVLYFQDGTYELDYYRYDGSGRWGTREGESMYFASFNADGTIK